MKIIFNPQQQQAIHSIYGALAIYAGAGSGKTMVITHRMAYMIQQGIHPAHIMAVTFTNKAAKEMKERLEKIVGSTARYVTVSTFHSICAKFLRIFAHKINYSPDFSIYDDTESKALLKEVIAATTQYSLDLNIVKKKIEDYKNLSLTPEEAFKKILDNFKKNEYIPANIRYTKYENEEVICKIYQNYQNKLKEQNAMDFGDLILNMNILLESSADVLSTLQNRYKFFLVDEFQDTNPAQFYFIQKLSSHTQNLCIVGDDDQSIYSWRGATPAFILDFQKYYPDATIIKLEENYRSTQNIIRCASNVIRHNQKRTPKTLWTQAPKGNPVGIKETLTAHHEAQFIVASLLEALKNGYKLENFAILYRTNQQSRILEEELRKHMIPYVIFGATRFYDRAEIKLITNYLKLLINPQDDLAFLKVINAPRRGIGEKTLERLKEIAQNTNLSLLRTAIKITRRELPYSLGRSEKGFQTFCEQYLRWMFLLEEKQASLAQLVQTIISDTKLFDYLDTTYDFDDAQDRRENLMEFHRAILDFENSYSLENLNAIAQENNFLNPSEHSNIPASTVLSEFLQQIQLITDASFSKNEGVASSAVTLMTIHAAKGLEFDNVFIYGVNEGYLPHIRAESPQDVEEERRLFYVAITRARKNLILTYAKTHPTYYDFLKPSRFLSELPEECCYNFNDDCSSCPFFKTLGET